MSQFRISQNTSASGIILCVNVTIRVVFDLLAPSHSYCKRHMIKMYIFVNKIVFFPNKKSSRIHNRLEFFGLINDTFCIQHNRSDLLIHFSPLQFFRLL